MKPTIRSIARMCGVSRGTVDRVLNNRPYVKPAVKERVLRAIRETGYVHPRLPERASSAVHIGFLIPHWEDDYFRKQTERGIRRAQHTLRPSELSLTTDAMTSRSDDEYIHRLDHMLTCGVQGVILNAADNVLLRTMIDQLADRGLPVVTYNSDLPTSRRVCHVGQDLLKSGEIAAGLLARSLGHADHILAVTGNMEFLAHRVRIDGFFGHCGKLGISSDRLSLVECFERYDLTYDAVLDALRGNSRLRGVYMGTESVPACMDAIKKAHLRHKIHVVANDLTPRAARYLKNDLLDFIIQQDFSSQAYEAIMIMYQLLAHDRAPKAPVRYVTTSIYTKELL